jgi:hypothetical protein
MKGQIMDISFEAENAAMAEAVRYAKDEDNRWLLDLRDPFIDRAMTEATSGVAFKTEPEPGRAVLVMSNDLGLHEHYDADSTYGYRWWRYLDSMPADRHCANGEDALCHRCGPTYMLRRSGSYVFRPIAAIIHIARGRYVVEFALCAECRDYYKTLADTAIRRVSSGDTYVEFEG